MLAVVNEFTIGALCPTPRTLIEFFGKCAHGNRYGDSFGIEKAKFVLPI